MIVILNSDKCVDVINTEKIIVIKSDHLMSDRYSITLVMCDKIYIKIEANTIQTYYDILACLNGHTSRETECVEVKYL